MLCKRGAPAQSCSRGCATERYSNRNTFHASARRGRPEATNIRLSMFVSAFSEENTLPEKDLRETNSERTGSSSA